MKVEIFDQRKTRYWDRQRCKEMIPTNYVTDKPFNRCKLCATYKIDDVGYCTQHAGIKALTFLRGQK